MNTESCREAAAKIKAGSKTVMTPEERRDFLMNSEYGKLAGVSEMMKQSAE